ncbi:Hypothetical_protein [Hexamita inflata]|uniref:Hypothetical_protein n=1 Tax=Hexamita inflata TaxID=28002 RepID=A0AA86UFP5_9EUKA|nr:Hypothetical protein HINF_LOCUS37082 [Hexamita inflata]
MQLMLYPDPRPLLFVQHCNVEILRNSSNVIFSLMLFVLLFGVSFGVIFKLMNKLELLENLSNKSNMQFESVKQELKLLGMDDTSSLKSNTAIPVQIFVQRNSGQLLSRYQNNFDFE